MKVLVHGAGGTQGLPLVHRLLARGDEVRAYSRDPARAADLAAAGAEVVPARLDDTESLVRAGKGVDAVFVQVPASVPPAAQVDGGRAALTAAAEAQVPHVVVSTSSIVPARRTGAAAPDAKHELARLVDELTPQAVVLRPTLYLDNIAQTLRPALDAGALPYPIPAEVPVAWLAVGDLAAFAAAALGRPDLAGRRLAIGGPESLTGTQLADRIGRVLGHAVAYQAIPPAAFGAQLAPFLGDEVATALAEMYDYEGGPGAADLAPDLAPALAALPLTLTTADAWARGALR